MPVNLYEGMFLLDTSKMSGDVAGNVAKLHAVLEKHKAEILASRPWDDRKLAYQIRNQKKGLYYLIYFRCDTKNLVELEHDFKLNETIMRLLILHIEPKLEEEMLAVARDERALALQTAHDEGLDAVEGYEPMGSRKD
ncbi:MAG TPA: 30S ribosomal protein S6 [Gemmataceae bacterium]|nr:30S ribosomal protein S6 [Gemmataceae bacterium]